MTPPIATNPQRDLYWTLYAADRDLGFCLLAFPVSTFLWGAPSRALGQPSPDASIRCAFLDRPGDLRAVLRARRVLRASWRERRDAENAPELHTEWLRDIELYSASRSGEGVLVFVIGTFFLALLTALGNSGNPRPDTTPLVIMGLFALGSWLGVLLVRRSRRHLKAAGISQEDVDREIATTWRIGAFSMIVIGAGALACMILAFDLLAPADRPWSLGSALGYTSTGILLLWRNRQKRGARNRP